MLNWNKPAETSACIGALSRQHYTNLEIFVVDNGSAEALPLPPASASVPVTLIRNPHNRGFAGGVNIGIGHALRSGAAYIWLVNNDAYPELSALRAMLEVMRADPSIGIASPVILNGDANDAVEFCGGLWWEDTFRTTNDPAVAAYWSGEYPGRIWLVGTAMLLHREAVERIGPFDENLFAYWEDNDYSVRSVRAGFRNVVVPQAVVRHCSGAARAVRPLHYHYYMARNEILFLRKHLPLARRPRLLWWALERQIRLVRETHAPAAQTVPWADAVVLGLWDGLRGRGGAFDPSRRAPAVLRRLFNRAAG